MRSMKWDEMIVSIHDVGWDEMKPDGWDARRWDKTWWNEMEWDRRDEIRELGSDGCKMGSDKDDIGWDERRQFIEMDEMRWDKKKRVDSEDNMEWDKMIDCEMRWDEMR